MNTITSKIAVTKSVFLGSFVALAFVAGTTLHAVAGPVDILASMAWNVADSDGDGFGDNISDGPTSNIPVLMSAGVDLSGGAGVNGTVRLQFEWGLSALLGLGSIKSAKIILNTSVGSVDSLDTFFYHGTSDQDGMLSNSDFEAPASQIAGVVMPVVGGPGTDGMFMFDVTDLLRADVLGGNDFFSVQGRVDESAEGPARGLQVRTNSTSNADLRPRLLVDVPEPATLAVFGLGLAGLGFVRRRKAA
jgi:hypothetical protein